MCVSTRTGSLLFLECQLTLRISGYLPVPLKNPHPPQTLLVTVLNLKLASIIKSLPNKALLILYVIPLGMILYDSLGLHTPNTN